MGIQNGDISQKNLAAAFDAAAAKGHMLSFFKAIYDEETALRMENGKACFITRELLREGYYYTREIYDVDDATSSMEVYADESLDKIEMVGNQLAGMDEGEIPRVQLSEQQISKILKDHFELERTIDIVEKLTGGTVTTWARDYARKEHDENRHHEYSRYDFIDGYIALKDGFNAIAECVAEDFSVTEFDKGLGFFTAVRLAGTQHFRN